MLHDPFVSYELAKAHQEELWHMAQRGRWAKDASASGPQRTDRLLFRVSSRLWAMAFRQKARGKMIPHPVGTSKHSVLGTITSGCQRSAENTLYHPSLPSQGARQPNETMPAAQGVPHLHGAHGPAGCGSACLARQGAREGPE